MALHSLSLFGFAILGLIVTTASGVALLSLCREPSDQGIPRDIETPRSANRPHEYYRYRAGSVSSMIHVSPSHPVIFGQGRGFRENKPVPVVQVMVTPPTPNQRPPITWEDSDDNEE